jgi:hypothetical protein
MEEAVDEFNTAMRFYRPSGQVPNPLGYFEARVGRALAKHKQTVNAEIPEQVPEWVLELETLPNLLHRIDETITERGNEAHFVWLPTRSEMSFEPLVAA